MKRIAFIIAASALGMGVISCGNPQQNSNAEQPKETEIVEEVVEVTPTTDQTPTQNATSMQGVYKGTIAAADCGGVETTLSIAADGSFSLSETCEGKTTETKGMATLDAEKNIVTLEVSPEDKRFFAVDGDKLIMCQEDGTLPEADMVAEYTLTKVAAE